MSPHQERRSKWKRYDRSGTENQEIFRKKKLLTLAWKIVVKIKILNATIRRETYKLKKNYINIVYCTVLAFKIVCCTDLISINEVTKNGLVVGWIICEVRGSHQKKLSINENNSTLIP